MRASVAKVVTMKLSPQSNDVISRILNGQSDGRSCGAFLRLIEFGP